MSCAIRLTLVVFLALGGATANAQSSIARVIDGDTIDVAGTHIRLWGIDAPESKQQCERDRSLYSCGLEAAAHLRAIIRNARITCEPRTVDRYGRTVALCRADDVDMGAAMVRDGWAMAFVRYSRDYVGEEREREARDVRRTSSPNSPLSCLPKSRPKEVKELRTRHFFLATLEYRSLDPCQGASVFFLFCASHKCSAENHVQKKCGGSSTLAQTLTARLSVDFPLNSNRSGNAGVSTRLTTCATSLSKPF